MSDASQAEDAGLSADVVDLTERRRLQRVEERQDQWAEMCFQVVQNLVPHPTDLGDVEHVSPTSWSRAKSVEKYNKLYGCLVLLAERYTEGADREDLLQFAFVLPTFVHTLFALDGEEVDVPEAIHACIDRLAETMQVTTATIMDGEITPDEKREMFTALQALEAATKASRLAVTQTPEQTSLWPARANGPRV